MRVIFFVGRDDVGDVADDEEFAWVALEYEFWGNTGVTAADDHGIWFLAVDGEVLHEREVTVDVFFSKGLVAFEHFGKTLFHMVILMCGGRGELQENYFSCYCCFGGERGG